MLLDLIGFFPVSICKYTSKYHPTYSAAQYSLTFNLAYTPRIYTMFLVFKLYRIRNFSKYLHNWLRKLGTNLIFTSMILVILELVLILHLIACFWVAASEMDTGTNVNWITTAGIENMPNMYKYLTALYWATVTAMTIGYGDIIPTNIVETSFCNICFIIGVSYFSYALSSFSNLIQDLMTTKSRK